MVLIIYLYYLEKTSEYGENSKVTIFQIPVSYKYRNYNYPRSDSDYIKMIRSQLKT